MTEIADEKPSLIKQQQGLSLSDNPCIFMRVYLRFKQIARRFAEIG